MNRNDLCWCGSGLKYKKCHLAFDEKLDGMKFDFFKGQVRPPHKIIKNAADIEAVLKEETAKSEVSAQDFFECVSGSKEEATIFIDAIEIIDFLPKKKDR